MSDDSKFPESINGAHPSFVRRYYDEALKAGRTDWIAIHWSDLKFAGLVTGPCPYPHPGGFANPIGCLHDGSAAGHIVQDKWASREFDYPDNGFPNPPGRIHARS